MLEPKIVTLSRIDYETIEPSEEEVLAYLTLEGSPNPVILIPTHMDGYKQFYQCVYGAETLSIAQAAECSDCAAYIAEDEEQLEALCILLGIELEDEEDELDEESEELDEAEEDENEVVVDEIGDLDDEDEPAPAPEPTPAPTPAPTPTTPEPTPAPEPVNSHIQGLADKYNIEASALEDVGAFFPSERQRKGSIGGVAQVPEYRLCSIKHIELADTQYTKEQLKHAKAQLLFCAGNPPALPMVCRDGYKDGTYTYRALADNVYLAAAKELYAEKRMEFIGCLVMPNTYAAFVELHPAITSKP